MREPKNINFFFIFLLFEIKYANQKPASWVVLNLVALDRKKYEMFNISLNIFAHPKAKPKLDLGGIIGMLQLITLTRRLCLK